MPSKLPWFPFYPVDFATDNKVMAMTTEEVGCYFWLLCIAWSEEPPGTIPDDDETIRRWLRIPLEEWLRYKPRVTAAFVFKDGRWHQKRMIHEAWKSQQIVEARSKAGIEGNLKRWSQHCCKAIANGSQTDRKGIANTSTFTVHSSQKKRKI